MSEAPRVLHSLFRAAESLAAAQVPEEVAVCGWDHDSSESERKSSWFFGRATSFKMGVPHMAQQEWKDPHDLCSTRSARRLVVNACETHPQSTVDNLLQRSISFHEAP